MEGNPLFARMLRESRLARNLSLADLANISGVTAATICRIENGKTDPRFDGQLRPLLDAMGLTVQFLTPTFKQKKGNTK